MISTIFDNHISYIHSEIHLYEGLLLEKRPKAEKLQGIQGKASTILGLTSEIPLALMETRKMRE